ncbi:hypothetical protein N7517_003688 [Penicillium concentricum]|uniref:F-box domain-containing protein n=1 Tax=Penicillium concentricum TaxID=293559 RepID=A0A9W9V7J4_9EURO|nr:uncharacterized protein N7517_003688 [Penicillium concentricum]KAJ5371682.1 hypothetical protein N7517_003688 [Penicillium concentricum]
MSIEVLPAELILLIFSFLPSESSIAALALSNRHFYATANPYLYQNNVRQGNSSALDWAAQNGRIDTLQKALDAGAPLPKEQWKYPKRVLNFQPHPISLAAKFGHANIVRYMVDVGVDPNIRDADCFTPLTVAALAGHASVVKYLLDVGTRQHVEHEKCVWFAAIHGHVNVVDIILSAPKQLGSECDKEELLNAALSAAIHSQRIPVLRLLFTHGVQVNVLGEGESPISRAAATGNRDLVSQLLAYGADPNLIKGRRKSLAPLTVAVMNGHEEIAQMVVRETESLHRTRALAFAISEQNRRMAEMLLRSGAPPQFDPSEIPELEILGPWEYDLVWVQPLLLAVRICSLELVELLLEYGADVNVECTEHPNDGVRREYGRALFLAVEKSDEAMVDLLLKGGADPEVTDIFGQPPLTYAVYRDHEAIVRSLLDHGANPYHAVDHSGRKLLFFWQMKHSTFLQLQEAEIKWSKQHLC